MPGMNDYKFGFTGAGESRRDISGDFFHIIDAPTDIQIEFNRDGRLLDRATGMGGSKEYDSVTIHSPVAQTVVVALGFGTSFDSRATVNANVTATIEEGNTRTSTPDVNLPAIATNQVLPADLTRLTAIIENLSATVTLRIGGVGTAAASGNTLAPGEKIVLDGTAEILAHNPDAAAVFVAVSAIREV